MKKVFKFLLFPAAFAAGAFGISLLPVWLGVFLFAVFGVFVQHNNPELADKAAAFFGL